jgi:hypothetical protein
MPVYLQLYLATLDVKAVESRHFESVTELPVVWLEAS